MSTIYPDGMEGDVTVEQWAALIAGLLGAGGVGGAVIDRVFRRRGDRADVLDKLEAISGRLAESAEKRMEHAEERVRLVEQRLRDHQERDADRDHRRRLAAARHIQWDNQIRDRLAHLGVQVDSPPPLEDFEL